MMQPVGTTAQGLPLPVNLQMPEQDGQMSWQDGQISEQDGQIFRVSPLFHEDGQDGQIN
jgi:hypothetical protein